jgi:hypothetical protein
VPVPRHADARPGSSRAAGPVIKLHRRVVRLGGHDHTVLTLRPVARVRFSTNFFHDTWHILSDGHGAQVLARLLWGLSYQARPGTIVLLDEANLDPNPFDAEPARPVAIVPARMTAVTGPLLRELRHGDWRHRRPAGTVRWRTHGLDAAVAADREGSHRWPRSRARPVEQVTMRAGVITVTADADRLRRLAVEAARLPDWWYNGESWMRLDHPAGEVQIWREYHRMVSIARAARTEVLADPDAASGEPPVVQERIWRRGAEVRRRRYGPPASG